jgi:hypothetical protein
VHPSSHPQGGILALSVRNAPACAAPVTHYSLSCAVLQQNGLEALLERNGAAEQLLDLATGGWAGVGGMQGVGATGWRGASVGGGLEGVGRARGGGRAARGGTGGAPQGRLAVTEGGQGGWRSQLARVGHGRHGRELLCRC